MSKTRTERYNVRFDGDVRVVVNINEPACGFAFLDENGNLESCVTARETEILNELNEDIAGCIAAGWVEMVEEEMICPFCGAELKAGNGKTSSSLPDWQVIKQNWCRCGAERIERIDSDGEEEVWWEKEV